MRPGDRPHLRPGGGSGQYPLTPMARRAESSRDVIRAIREIRGRRDAISRFALPVVFRAWSSSCRGDVVVTHPPGQVGQVDPRRCFTCRTGPGDGEFSPCPYQKPLSPGLSFALRFALGSNLLWHPHDDGAGDVVVQAAPVGREDHQHIDQAPQPANQSCQHA